MPLHLRYWARGGGKLVKELQYNVVDDSPLVRGLGMRWGQRDTAVNNMLFDAFVEYVRLNLFGTGERHYGGAIMALAWLANEVHFKEHPGRGYVLSLLMQVQRSSLAHRHCCVFLRGSEYG